MNYHDINPSTGLFKIYFDILRGFIASSYRDLLMTVRQLITTCICFSIVVITLIMLYRCYIDRKSIFFKQTIGLFFIAELAALV